MSFRNAFRNFLLSSCALALFSACAPASVDGICDDVNNPCPVGLACIAGQCGPQSCTNQVQEGSETDIDCGGPCAPCADLKKCAAGRDCQSKVCGADGHCAPAACDDRVQNGTETAVDCGGSCAPCAHGQGCSLATDCSSGTCAQNPDGGTSSVCGQCTVGQHATADGCAPNTVNSCCGTSCATCVSPPNGTSSCTNATGAFSCGFVCGAGFHDDGHGGCTTDTNTASCGSPPLDCSTQTPPPLHATEVCSGGTCGYICATGFHDVGAGANPCATDNQVNKCGSTDVDCTQNPPSNTAPQCSQNQAGTDFVCDYSHCASGFHLVGNGCVANNTPACCGGTGGSCNAACPPDPANGAEVCNAGATQATNSCGVACNSGFHLNATTQACDPNITTACCGGTGGTCNASCPAAPLNGTEVCNLGATQATNSCGFTCNDGFHLAGSICVANNTAACCGGAGGSCNVCPGSPANGTEVCNTGATPSANSCGFTCSAGFHASGSLCVVDNTPAACGTSDVNCVAVGPPSNLGSASCVPSGADFVCQYTCADGFHLSGNACLANNTTACCGGTGGNCNAPCPAAPSGGSESCSDLATPATNTCFAGCPFSFHLNSATNSCEQDTNACCGSNCDLCGGRSTCNGGFCSCDCAALPGCAKGFICDPTLDCACVTTQ